MALPKETFIRNQHYRQNTNQQKLKDENNIIQRKINTENFLGAKCRRLGQIQ